MLKVYGSIITTTAYDPQAGHCRDQEVKKVRAVWKAVSPATGLDVNRILEWTNVEEYKRAALESKKGATVWVYLSALAKFLKFLQRYESLKSRAKTMCNDLNMLIKGLKSKDKVKTVERTRQEELFAREKVVGLIDQAYNSENARRAMKVLDECRDNPDYTLSVEDYTLVAALFVFRLVQTCAQRVSVIIGLTLREFCEATLDSNPKSSNDGKWLITVVRHKTGDQAPAVLVVNSKFHQQLSCFMTSVRPLCYTADDELNNPDDTFFVNFTNSSGIPTAKNLKPSVDATTVNKWLKKLSPLCATILRKASTINVRQRAPESADKVAKFLNHSKATADRYYALGDRVQHAPEVHQLIGETMGTGDVLDTDQWTQADGDHGTEDGNRRMEQLAEETQGRRPRRFQSATATSKTPMLVLEKTKLPPRRSQVPTSESECHTKDSSSDSADGAIAPSVMYSDKVKAYEVKRAREDKKQRKVRFSKPEVALLTKLDDQFGNQASERMFFSALKMASDGPQLIERITASLLDDGRPGTGASKFIMDKVRTIRKAAIRAKEREAFEGKLSKRR